MMHLYTDRNMQYSYLRAVACIAIILLHICNAAEILYRDTITLTEKVISLSVVSCMMWAVPCFVMVSGALLLNPERKITIGRIFSRYIRRMILALAICCILFRGFDMVMNGEPLSIAFITDGIMKMLTAGSWAHLWYLYLLIGIYLLLPFYRKVAEHSTETELNYLLLIYFLFLSVLQITQLAGVQIGFYIHVSTIYPFYFFAGYMIANRKKPVSGAVICTMLTVGFAGVIICTWIRWAYQIEALDCLLNYSSVFTVLLSCGIFALFCNGAESGNGAESENGAESGNEAASGNTAVSGNKAGNTGKKRAAGASMAGKILASIDENSFGIYLFHMILVRAVLRYYGLNPFRYGAWMFLTLTAVVFVITYLVIRLLRLIPAVRTVL